MDAGTITIIVGIGGFILASLTYIAGSRKSSEERAWFGGEIKATLQQLIGRFDRLEDKLTKNTSELYEEIAKRIQEQETRYHK